MKLLSILVVILMLAGCAAPSASPEFDFGKNPGMGLLAGSLTTDDPGNFFSQDVYIYFGPSDPHSKLPRVKVTINNHCKPGERDIDFTKPCGKLFAFVVPAGDYVLNEWHIQDAGGGTISPASWHGGKVTVQSGKATYVGEIHMVFDPNLPGSGPADWRGWPSASDRHERDMPLLLRRLPLIRQDDIMVQLPDLDLPGRVCNSAHVGVVGVTFC